VPNKTKVAAAVASRTGPMFRVGVKARRKAFATVRSFFRTSDTGKVSFANAYVRKA
jgi:hypothetical protein